MDKCWCDSRSLQPFGPGYGVCGTCGTLVSIDSLPVEQLAVTDDETDFYGKQYWLGHQQEDLGFPDIVARSRNDLTERNLHWLGTLLKYRLPPARVMELGCAHGSFVALMSQAGFNASGMEMSPWVVAFGEKTFGISVHLGPIEAVDLPAGGFDVIALMDVLEHLPDPLQTMRRCLELLSSEGVLLIQTPQFREEMRHEALLQSDAPFLKMLQADEHLYLFSERSVKALFKQLGAEHICFEPAIFAHYDMFMVVSRVPLRSHGRAEVEESLLSTPGGRLTLALLDLREREERLIRQLSESETDRAERGQQIEILTRMVQAGEKDGTGLRQQIEILNTWLKSCEEDRAARGAQIESLTQMVLAAQEDGASLRQQIDTLNKLLKSS
ncbi:MAG: methyltransferase domain-containing protein [Azonexus sp.]|jgi:2-polyprenyl-3-methyl-5-hydroxy-6-metoxy-1,4-benzoquinol methylase|nr:methyltransferase domain-containing protein [Azonexus sp.]